MRLVTQLTVAALAVGGVTFWSSGVARAADAAGAGDNPSPTTIPTADNSDRHASGDKEAGSTAAANDAPTRSAADSPTTQPAGPAPTPGTGDTKSNPPAPGPGGGSPAIPPTNPPDPSVGGKVHTNSGSR